MIRRANFRKIPNEIREEAKRGDTRRNKKVEPR